MRRQWRFSRITNTVLAMRSVLCRDDVSRLVLAFADQCHNEDAQTKCAQSADPLILVLSAAHKDCKAGSRNHKEQHPEVEILMHEKRGRDDRQDGNQHRRQQAVHRAKRGEADRNLIKPSMATTFCLDWFHASINALNERYFQ